MQRILRAHLSQRSCRTPKRSLKANKTGVSLVELIVVFFLVSLISTVLITLVGQSSALVSHGIQVIALNQKARFTVDKMAPYVITATSSRNTIALTSPSAEAEVPSAAEIASYKSIKFTTTEDFLDEDYDVKAAWNPLNTDRFYYEIYFDETNPSPYLQEDGTTINLGRVLLRRYDDTGFTTLSNQTDYPPHGIGFNVQHFFCHRLGTNSLEVRVYTVGKRKGPQGNLIDVHEQAQAMLNLPSATY